MSPKHRGSTTSESRKGTIVVPSKVHSKTGSTTNPADLVGVEETEITAQISVPTEGGWGWVVVLASFLTIFVLDGIYFTFGSVLKEMTYDLAVDESLVALVNSIAVALYFVGGPLVSALINRFGFRAIAMTGSITSSMALLGTYFAADYMSILFLYGLVGGVGACLCSMPSGLIVGFYFERLRSLAMAISSTGSSLGIMVLFSVNTYIVNLAGWRVLMLFHSGLVASTYFFTMSFKPLLSLTVTTAPITDTTTATTERTRTITYLPSLGTIKTPSKTKKDEIKASAAERLFSAVSNAHFPTAAAVIGESVAVQQTDQAGQTGQIGQPGTSYAAVPSRLIVTAQGPQSGMSKKQLKQVQSLVSKSRTSVPEKDKEGAAEKVELVILEKGKPQKWWQKLFHWEQHIAEARPMYRDDAFYEGPLDRLPVYQKSMMDTTPAERTGLEYQMAVTRAVTAADLGEKRGVYTSAVRRVLATMMDPKLLKRRSFLLLCSSGFFTYLGFLVPYVYLPDRNLQEGIDPTHCSLFISVMGFANACGRLVIGTIAMKVNPVNLYALVCLISGLAVIAFNFSFNLYYQYAICVLFGFHIASLSSMRSIVIVQLFGLDMLTNATGVMIMFQGVGSLISTPLSGVLKNQLGYDVSFYVAGIFVCMSGIVLVPASRLNDIEKERLKEKEQAEETKKVATPTLAPASS
ncbi:monocarboxylate transporter 4-like [Spodoptera litura]|uniref:Monocarboxylate transporter 4-like n=1 Tax=Spodoptera litura TaxID=69820 RepID=A0A9J7EKF0_SPOLT|nr:monocarboxylate transporter 4-like [Spodoptera litura]